MISWDKLDHHKFTQLKYIRYRLINVLDPPSLLLFSPVSLLLPLFCLLPCSPAVLPCCLLSTTCILLSSYAIFPRDLPAGWASLHAHPSSCCLSGEMAALGLDPELCLSGWGSEKRWRELDSFTVPFIYGTKAVDQWANWKVFSMHFSSAWNSHQWLPAASQPFSQPWLSSTAETWKSFTSTRVLPLICHFPNTSHLYCSKQYISHQTVPNLSSLLLDPLYLFNRGAA